MCISELVRKVDADAVRPSVPSLLEGLLVCFRDQSWPVRQAACCGRREAKGIPGRRAGRKNERRQGTMNKMQVSAATFPLSLHCSTK